MIRMLQVNLLVPARTAYDKNATGEPLVLVHTLYSCKCIRCSRIYLVVIGLTLTHRYNVRGTNWCQPVIPVTPVVI